MWLAILYHFLCAQHVSDINISIIRSLRLCCWTTTSVVLFSVRCVMEIWCGWVWVVLVLQASACKLLMMDILMSETCWAYKKWNKIASDVKLVFNSSTITMMHGPINVRFLKKKAEKIIFKVWVKYVPNRKFFFGSLSQGLKARDLKSADCGMNAARQFISSSPPTCPPPPRSVILLRIIECGPAQRRGFFF